MNELVQEAYNVEKRLGYLEENLNELYLMAESNFHDINDTRILFKKSEDIQQEVDELHNEILELKTNGNL